MVYQIAYDLEGPTDSPENYELIIGGAMYWGYRRRNLALRIYRRLDV